MSRSRVIVMTVALVTLFTLLPDAAYAARTCKVEIADTPEARATLWTEALENFTAASPNLSAEQTQWLREAAGIGNEIATLKADDAAQATFARKATRFLEQGRELFTNDQLGRLFTDMGETQLWLAKVAAGPAYCNCSGAGPCTFSGGPTGTCNAGCVSWDGDGTRWDGLCSPAAAD